MTQPTSSSAAPAGRPAIDVLAILASLQDQLDDLTATVASQQTEIERLSRSVRRGTS